MDSSFNTSKLLHAEYIWLYTFCMRNFIEITKHLIIIYPFPLPSHQDVSYLSPYWLPQPNKSQHTIHSISVNVHTPFTADNWDEGKHFGLYFEWMWEKIVFPWIIMCSDGDRKHFFLFLFTYSLSEPRSWQKPLFSLACFFLAKMNSKCVFPLVLYFWVKVTVKTFSLCLFYFSEGERAHTFVTQWPQLFIPSVAAIDWYYNSRVQVLSWNIPLFEGNFMGESIEAWNDVTFCKILSSSWNAPFWCHNCNATWCITGDRVWLINVY